MKSAILIACAALMLPGDGRAQELRARTMTRDVAAGKTVVLGSHVSWNANCEGMGGWAVDLVRAPKYGSVCVRRAIVTPEGTLSVVRDEAKHCIGQPMQGFEVVYTARASAAGQDQVGYVYGIRRPQVKIEASIDVRPAAGSTVGHADEATNEQSPVKMSECAALGS